MNGIKGLSSSTTISAPPSTTGLIQQRNLLLIHVDSLENDDPQLVSMWGVFFYPAESSNITFKQLYPSANEINKLDTSFKDQFRINDVGEMNTKTIRALNTYDIDWSGYILLDTRSMLHLTNWLQMDAIPESIAQAIQTPGTFIQIADEQQWFNQVCTQLENEDLANLQHLPWNEIIPAHMHTNLYFDDMVTFWDDLARSEYTPHCEVLVP